MEEIKELLLQHPHKHQGSGEVIPATAMSPPQPLHRTRLSPSPRALGTKGSVLKAALVSQTDGSGKSRAVSRLTPSCTTYQQ